MPVELVKLPNGQVAQQDTDTGKVRVAKGGSVYWVDSPSDAVHFIEQEGYAPATPEQVDQQQGLNASTARRIRAAGHSIAAGAAGAATGIGQTVAMAPVVAERAVADYAPGLTDEDRERMRAAALLKQELAQEVLSGRGVVSNIAGAIAGPEGYTAARDIQRVDERQLAGLTTAGKVLGQVGVGLATTPGSVFSATGAAGRIGAGALEGAALGAAETMDRAYLENHAVTAEEFVAGSGLGAILGGVVPLGGHMLGQGARAAARGARSAAEGIFGTAESALGTAGREAAERGIYRTAAAVDDDSVRGVARRALGGLEPEPGTVEAAARIARESGEDAGSLNRVYANAAATITGADEKAIAEVGAFNWSAAARDKRALWLRRSEIIDDATARVADDVSDMMREAETAFEVARRNELKADAIRSKIPALGDMQTAAVESEFNALRVAANQAADIATEAGNRKLGRSLTTEIEALGSRAAQSDDAAERFVLLDRAKKSLGSWNRTIQRSTQRVSDPFQRQKLTELSTHLQNTYEETRKFLTNDDLWGEAANVQRTVNAAWEDHLEGSSIGRFRDALTRREPGEWGVPRLSGDTSKAASYLQRTGSAAMRDTDDAVRNHVITTRRLLSSMQEMMDLAPEQATAVVRAQQAADKLQKTLAQVDETVRVANQVQSLVGSSDGVMGQLGAVGGGAVLGGLPGAAAGAAISAVTNPGQAIKQLARVEALTAGLRGRQTGALKSFFSRADRAVKRQAQRALGAAMAVAEPAERVAQKTAVPTAVAVFGSDRKQRRDTFTAKAAPLLAYRANPEAVVERIRKSGEGLAAVAPRLGAFTAAQQLRAIDYLAGKLPQNQAPSLTPHLETMPVSDTEIADFAEAYTAVDDPLSVLDDLGRGGVSLTQIEAIRTVYPQLYESMKMDAIQLLSERTTEVPYAARKQLDLLFDLNGFGEPSLAPDAMQRAAMAGQAEQQRQPQPPPPRRRSPERAGRFEPGNQLQEL